MENLEAIIEAILFSMGDSVALEDIAATIEQDEETTRKLLHHMMDRYSGEEHGIQILELEDHFQLCTKAKYYDALIRLASVPKKAVLTDVMMETLAIIAYRQPVTRLEIEKIRGVKSDFSVNKLLEYGLIEEAGRLNAPGRPIQFRTSEEFLRKFGLASVEDLPQLPAMKLEEFRTEAESEADDITV